MKHRILASAVFAVLLVLSCSRARLVPPPSGVHLRADRAITYYLDRSANDAIELATRESFQLWSDATSFKFAYGGKARALIARDGRNMVIFMARWPKELPIGTVGWTQVYLDSAGRIVEADILLNAQAFSFTTRREAKPGSLYIEDVLAKEIGKSLGIGFDSVPDTSASFRVASSGDAYEPGIDPAEMAAYLSLYETSPR